MRPACTLVAVACVVWAGSATASPPTLCAPLTPAQVEYLDASLANARNLSENLCAFAAEVCRAGSPRCGDAQIACESTDAVRQTLADFVAAERRR